MERELDYSQRTEAELVEMFGRMDPRYAQLECARLGKHLAELGYIVTQGDTGPGSVTPTPHKLQALIGSPRPFECDVEFGKTAAGPASYREPTHNDYGFEGAGKLLADGICVYLSGRIGRGPRIAPAFLQDQIEVPTRRIVNVESYGRLVRFE